MSEILLEKAFKLLGRSAFAFIFLSPIFTLFAIVFFFSFTFLERRHNKDYKRKLFQYFTNSAASGISGLLISDIFSKNQYKWKAKKIASKNVVNLFLYFCFASSFIYFLFGWIAEMQKAIWIAQIQIWLQRISTKNA